MEDSASRLVFVFVKIMQMKKIARRQSEDAQGGGGEKTKKNGKSSTKPRKIDDATGRALGVGLHLTMHRTICRELATGKTSETISISRQAQLIRLCPKAACVARA